MSIQYQPQEEDDASPELQDKIRCIMSPLSVSPRLVRMVGADTAVFLAGLKEIQEAQETYSEHDDPHAEALRAQYEAHPGWHPYDTEMVEQYTGLSAAFQEVIIAELQHRKILQYHAQGEGVGLFRLLARSSA